MPDYSFFNPDKLNKLLNDERDGKLPPEMQQGLRELRQNKVLPPALIDAQFPSEVGRVHTGFEGAPPQRPGLPKPPEPKLSFGQEMSILPAEAWDATKAAAPAIGKGALEMGKSFLDPEALGATAAGLMTASRGTGVGMLASGAAAGGIALGQELWDRRTAEGMKRPLSDSIAPVGEAFVTGGVSNLVDRGLGLIGRPKMTPQGAAVGKFFGKNTMAQQTVDSPVLNFMAQVAKHGPGGQNIIRGVEEKQTDTILDYLDNLGRRYSPGGTTANTGTTRKSSPGGGTVNTGTPELDISQAGRRIAEGINTNRKAGLRSAKWPEFMQDYGDEQLTKGQKFGALVDPAEADEPIGKTVAQLHKERSGLLKTSRSKFITDPAGQANALEGAQKNLAAIEDILDRAGQSAYQSARDITRKTHRVFDNPTVKDVRLGAPEDTLDKVLTNRLKNKTIPGEEMGLTNKERLVKLRKSLSETDFNQLQTDALHRFGQMATDESTGQVSAGQMKKALDTLEPEVQRVLFGKNKAKINKVLGLVEQSQEFHKSEAGRLFIAIRSGGAAVALGQAGLGTVAAGLGSATGHPGLGAAGAAIILISPFGFAKLLTTEVGRRLVTRAAGANIKTPAGQQAKRALRQYIVQQGFETGREVVNEPSGAPDEDPNAIPEPPR